VSQNRAAVHHDLQERGHNQALGRSRGGFSTKIHLKTDLDGDYLAFDLSGGNRLPSGATRRFTLPEPINWLQKPGSRPPS
jgi:hypothetical protein